MHIIHKPISLKTCPGAWFRDKARTGLSHWQRYVFALTPSLIALIGSVASVFSVIGISKSTIKDPSLSLSYTLAIFVGLSCIFFAILLVFLSQWSVRIERARRANVIMHKEVIEPIKDFRAEKEIRIKTENPLTDTEIEIKIGEILKGFNDNYMKHVHRETVSATIKYLHDQKLYSIREGARKNERTNPFETIDECHVYNLLNRRLGTKEKPKREYIYIKDITKPDDRDKQLLGDLLEDIQERAKDHYKSFIAMPLRAGKKESEKNNVVWTAMDDLGFIGFDLNESAGFGFMSEQELEYLACFVDIMSEPVKDLVNVKNK